MKQRILDLVNASKQDYKQLPKDTKDNYSINLIENKPVTKID